MAVADKSRSRTWYFTFDLETRNTGAESHLKALALSPIRIARIETATIISFSSSEGYPDVRGFISRGSMLRATVQAWLTNPQISNLQLHSISD